ncbi:hypothetical protein [Shewanella algae]|uniref:hypothetical protein n=1 Tax=Shewanella algae TaxID=38313 RepID=UPI0031F519E6
MKNRNYYLVFLPILAILHGCGGGEEQNQDLIPAPPVSANIYAQDTVNYFSTTGLKRVDLSNRVSSATGAQLKLVDVKPLSKDPACRAVTIDGQLSFSIQQNDSLACDYRYRVQDSLGMYQAQASSRIMISERANILPPAIAPKSILLNENESKIIDLSYTDPQGKVYQLLEDTVLLGSGSIIIDTLNSSLTYTAAEKGTSRVLYHLQEINGEKILLGSIDIAVSSDGNIAPTVSYIDYAPLVKPGREIVIDVAEYISGEPGEQLQLTFADSFDAWVMPYDPLDITNTKLSFYADIPGDYYVTYTIDDHRGGIAIGMVKVSVENYYTNITLPSPDEQIFLAPISQAQAEKLGLNTTCQLDSSVDYPEFCPAQMDVSVAKAYCHSRGGRLPSADELMKLSESGIANGYWPTTSSYWANHNFGAGNYYSLNLAKGSESGSMTPVTEKLNVTCIADSLEYNVDIPFPEKVKTNSIIPISAIYYQGFDNVKKVYSGNIDFALNNNGTASSIIGDASTGYSLNTGDKPGIIWISATLIDPPAMNARVDFKVVVNSENNRGFWGKEKGSQKIFNFEKGAELYCIEGELSLKGLGQEHNYVEDITALSYPKKINLDKLKKLNITTAEFQKASWERVIFALDFYYTDGTTQRCGQKYVSTYVRALEESSIELKNDSISKEYISQIEVHYSPYIYGLGIKTTTCEHCQ